MILKIKDIALLPKIKEIIFQSSLALLKMIKMALTTLLLDRENPAEIQNFTGNYGWNPNRIIEFSFITLEAV